ncbi:MAG: hypothetical protein JO001_01060 [Alphaproteobacteria bacterium]|nr:hypothetical protein [Alphaproteobacteria bacterium]
MKHPDTGVYWFRKVVPAHLRGAVGKREIKKSLATKDPREAKQRYPAAAEEADRIIALAEGRVVPAHLSHQQVIALAGEWYREKLAKYEANPADEDQYDVLLSLAADADEDGRRGAFVKRFLDRLLEAKGLIIDTASHEALADRLFWEGVRLCNTLILRTRGDYTPDPHLASLPKWEGAIVSKAVERGASFDELVEAWALNANPTPTVKTNYARHMRLLAIHLGFTSTADADASKVARRDVLAFKEAELRAGKAPKTVVTELSGISAVFTHAYQTEKIASNPASKVLDIAALRAARRRGEKPRYPYSPDEAVRILQAARVEADADLRWLPWLCAFTGARISEVATARSKDIHELAGAWFIGIGLEGQQVKAGASRRRVPLHPVLVSEGFLAYAQSKAADERLFSSWAGDKVARWIRGPLGIADPKKGPSHSWRHRFEDEGRAAGIEEEIRDALAGHKNHRIGREYGHGYTDPRLLHRLVEAMNKIPVPASLI